MQQVVWISLVLLNVVWISVFLSPDLDFSVFVQRRSVSSSDETVMMEFCLQEDSDRKWTSTDVQSDRKWTSAGPSTSFSPDGDINTITGRPLNRKKTQHEESNSGDKFPTSAAPDPDQIDLYRPAASTDEQRLTSPPEFSSSSEAHLVTKIPTTSRNQKVNINQPDQQKITLSPLRPGTGMNGKKTQTEEFISDDKFPTSAAPDPDPDEIDLYRPTMYTLHEQRLTSPPEFSSSSEAHLVAKIPTTTRNQKNINQEKLTRSPPRPGAGSRNPPYLCCTKNYDKPLRLKYISSFRTPFSDCPSQGVIFLTVKQRLVCVDSQKPWVKRAMEHLKKKQH